MRIALGCDHAGYKLKLAIIELLKQHGHEVIDFGTHSEEMVDYPDFIRPAAEAVSRGEAERAIVLGGSGNGEVIVANKVPGIRAAVCHDVTTARLASLHNDANVISIGERITGHAVALECVVAWLETPFSCEERHVRRIEKIRRMEEEYNRT